MPAISEQRVRELAALAKLPAGTDLVRLAELISIAAEAYAGRAAAPTAGEVRAEIEALYRAADRGRYKIAAQQIEKLSEAARAWLNRRGRHRTVNVEIPTPAALLDAEQRERACADIVRLIRVGGTRGPGRNRPGGKRSVSFVLRLYLPTAQDHPPRREAERRLIEDLRAAWREVTGQEPAATTNPNRPGPFARFAQACLDAARSGGNAVVLINEQRRHEQRIAKLLSKPGN